MTDVVTAIVHDWPPNIAKIRAVLPVTECNIFAYGGKIYSPGAATLPPWLIAHEQVHFNQQGWWPAQWWRKFLKSPEFRLLQEIPAHQVEYRAFCALCHDRNKQSVYLGAMAKRLAAPMYGSMISVSDARRRIAA